MTWQIGGVVRNLQPIGVYSFKDSDQWPQPQRAAKPVVTEPKKPETPYDRKDGSQAPPTAPSQPCMIKDCDQQF